jgi:hypothetical protein
METANRGFLVGPSKTNNAIGRSNTSLTFLGLNGL